VRVSFKNKFDDLTKSCAAYLFYYGTTAGAVIKQRTAKLFMVHISYWCQWPMLEIVNEHEKNCFDLKK